MYSHVRWDEALEDDCFSGGSHGCRRRPGMCTAVDLDGGHMHATNSVAMHITFATPLHHVAHPDLGIALFARQSPENNI